MRHFAVRLRTNEASGVCGCLRRKRRSGLELGIGVVDLVGGVFSNSFVSIFVAFWSDSDGGSGSGWLGGVLVEGRAMS